MGPEQRTRSQRTAFRILGAAALMLVIGGMLAVLPPRPADAAGRCPCRRYGVSCNWPSGAVDLCLRADLPGAPGTPPSTGGPPTSGGPPDTGGGEPTWCPPRQWIRLGGYDSIPPHIRPYSWDDAPPGAVFYYDRCTCPASISYCPGGTTMWLMPDEAPPLPPPEDVAEDAWAELQTRLQPPELGTHPPDGEPSLLEFPTFVAVTNWQGDIQEVACDPTGVVCVEISAIPSLSWDPGEPRSRTVACEDGGTTYDPDGPPAEEQADAPGACAYSYQHRTGVDGRPDRWEGEVAVAWEATWETTAGPVEDSGSFGDVTVSTDLPREVVDLTTLVVEGLGGAA